MYRERIFGWVILEQIIVHAMMIRPCTFLWLSMWWISYHVRVSGWVCVPKYRAALWSAVLNRVIYRVRIFGWVVLNLRNVEAIIILPCTFLWFSMWWISYHVRVFDWLCVLSTALHGEARNFGTLYYYLMHGASLVWTCTASLGEKYVWDVNSQDDIEWPNLAFTGLIIRSCNDKLGHPIS